MAKKTLKHEKSENFLKIKIKLKGQNTYSKIWILDFCKINIVETKKRVNFDCPEFHARTWFWLMLYATVIWYKQFIWRDSVALDNNPCKISWSYLVKQKMATIWYSDPISAIPTNKQLLEEKRKNSERYLKNWLTCSRINNRQIDGHG